MLSFRFQTASPQGGSLWGIDKDKPNVHPRATVLQLPVDINEMGFKTEQQPVLFWHRTGAELPAERPSIWPPDEGLAI